MALYIRDRSFFMGWEVGVIWGGGHAKTTKKGFKGRGLLPKKIEGGGGGGVKFSDKKKWNETFTN